MCVLQMILLTKNNKKYMLELGPYRKDRKSTWDKTSMGDIKVNRGCTPFTANRTLADCVENYRWLSVQYIPLGLYHTGDFNAMYFIVVRPWLMSNISIKMTSQQGRWYDCHFLVVWRIWAKLYTHPHTQIYIYVYIYIYIYIYITVF